MDIVSRPTERRQGRAMAPDLKLLIDTATTGQAVRLAFDGIEPLRTVQAYRSRLAYYGFRLRSQTDREAQTITLWAVANPRPNSLSRRNPKLAARGTA